MKSTVRKAYLREQTLKRGPCLAIGSELWWVENVNVRVGTVEKIEGGIATIRTPEGLVKKTAADSLLMSAPKETE